MVVHGSTWQYIQTSMTVYSSTWRYMALHFPLSQSIAVYGSTWRYMDLSPGGRRGAPAGPTLVLFWIEKVLHCMHNQVIASSHCMHKLVYSSSGTLARTCGTSPNTNLFATGQPVFSPTFSSKSSRWNGTHCLSIAIEKITTESCMHKLNVRKIAEKLDSNNLKSGRFEQSEINITIHFNGKEWMPCLPCGGKDVMAVILY